MNYDVFISYASEDRQEVAKPLQKLLTDAGLRVWFDDTELDLGDGLKAHLDHAISQSRYAVAILSSHYVKKTWTNNELAAFFSLENRNRKVILPIRHRMTQEDISKFSPLLANRLSVSTAEGLNHVSETITRVVRNRASAELFWNRKPIVLGLSGASCAGKTWLACKFTELYPGAVTLFDLDGYYKDLSYVQNLDHKHDNPQAIDFDKAIRDLAALKAGQRVSIPVHDFETHSVSGTRVCEPAPIILVEGLFAFYNCCFRDDLDVKVWIGANEIIRVARRIIRDTRERHRDSEEVVERLTRDVHPGFEKYIRPLQDYADAVFLNDGNDKAARPLIVEMLVAYLERQAAATRREG